MIEIVFELLFELLIQALGEFLLTLGWESIGHAVRRSRTANPIMAAVGWIIIGALCGAGSVLAIPHRLLPVSGASGVSVLLSPLVSGLLMKAVGDWRRAMGKDTTLLATFWGGAMFAFAIAATRFLLVRS